MPGPAIGLSGSAIVLCGGRSTRMGRDKASLAFGRESLLARVVRLAVAAADDVIVVAREGQWLPDGFAGTAVRDPAEGLGPLAGIAVGLTRIASDRAFVTGCDAPFLQPALIRRLLELSEGYEATVPVIDGQVRTTAAVYTRPVAAIAQTLVDRRQLRLSGLLDQLRVRRVDAHELRDVDPALESFRDCNTPESYEQALRDAGF